MVRMGQSELPPLADGGGSGRHHGAGGKSGGGGGGSGRNHGARGGGAGRRQSLAGKLGARLEAVVTTGGRIVEYNGQVGQIGIVKRPPFF